MNDYATYGNHRFQRKLVLGHINRTVLVKHLCKIFKTNRKTINKWVKRYKKYGIKGLEELSRAPKKGMREDYEIKKAKNG